MIFNTPAGPVGILHPPKCAGGTVKETLLSHFGEDQLIFPTQKIKTLKFLKTLRIDHYHYTYSQFKILRFILDFNVDPNVINWLVVVRDPIERLTSLYKWKYFTEINNKNNAKPLSNEFYNYVFNRNFTRKLPTNRMRIPSFVEFVSALETYCSKTELRPQSEYFCGIQKSNLHFVRQVCIETDLEYAFLKLNLQYLRKQKVRRHASGGSPMQDLGDTEISKVKTMFEVDFQLLDTLNGIDQDYQDDRVGM